MNTFSRTKHAISIPLLGVLASGCWTGNTTGPQQPDVDPPAHEPAPRVAAAPPTPASDVEAAAPPAAAPPASTPAPPPSFAVAPASSTSPVEAAAPPAEPAVDASTDAWRITARGGYLGGGALHLPVDGGLTAASIYGGKRFANTILEARLGGRLAYGDSRYASAVSLLAELVTIRWFGAFGAGLTTAGGVVFASRKGTTGWDGTLPGALVSGSARIRAGSIEPSIDLGILWAIGEDHPAPFVLLGATGRL
jgi:hypothetical protein